MELENVLKLSHRRNQECSRNNIINEKKYRGVSENISERIKSTITFRHLVDNFLLFLYECGIACPWIVFSSIDFIFSFSFLNANGIFSKKAFSLSKAWFPSPSSSTKSEEDSPPPRSRLSGIWFNFCHSEKCQLFLLLLSDNLDFTILPPVDHTLPSIFRRNGDVDQFLEIILWLSPCSSSVHFRHWSRFLIMRNTHLIILYR